MKGPTMLEYLELVAVCMLFALAGLYLLANFGRLFRNLIKNEWLRKNFAAWLIILCMSTAMLPLSGGFFYLLEKFGWGWVIGGQLLSATLCTLITYNLVRVVAESPQLKKLSFIKHNLLILLTLVITTLAINISTTHLFYGKLSFQFIKYTLVNSIYLAGTTGLVYAVINYLAIERQRKFNEKELELSRLRELKTQAELDALHSKINPHFLYNALNSIADLSLTNGQKARKMTIALADLFRYSINHSNNNFTTVKEELGMTETYLQIEKIRFEDQLNYSVQADPSLDHYLVPRFILQPLVENAVKHGLKATGKMTEILIEVKKTEGGLSLLISDNGPGFPEELVPGYGVKSVFDKMDLLFPGQYEIHFSNRPRKQVEIRILKLIKNEPLV